MGRGTGTGTGREAGTGDGAGALSEVGTGTGTERGTDVDGGIEDGIWICAWSCARRARRVGSARSNADGGRVVEGDGGDIWGWDWPSCSDGGGETDSGPSVPG